VTIPFKQDALEIVAPEDLAARIGAVNTIDFSGSGPPTGYNTDAVGTLRARCALTTLRLRVRERSLSAPAVPAERPPSVSPTPATVAIANRTESTARDLAAEVPRATDHGLGELDKLVADADVLVNATSVGMESAETPVPADALHDELTVLDAVYTPIETRLLRDAAAAGATTIDGAWMLLYQGVEAFEIWTGRTHLLM